jgi:hypothetical protein
MTLGRSGSGGSGERRGGDAAKSESGKLPHENSSSSCNLWTGKIYAAILNGRLLRLRIDLDHAARQITPSSHRIRISTRIPPRPIYMTRSSVGFAAETTSRTGPFQSLRQRQERG